MERPPTKIDPCRIEWATFNQKHRVQTMITLAEKYKTDPNKKARLEAAECLVCFYDKSRIGGAAITSQPCGNCGEMLHSGNTNMDILCAKCAKVLGLCKHCGATINLTKSRGKSQK